MGRAPSPTRVLVEEGRTAATFIAVDREGRRVIYALGGKALLESPEEVDAEYLAGARLIYLGEAFPEVVAPALREASRRGVRLVYAPGGVFCSMGLGRLRPLLEAADLVLLSRGELRTLTGASDPGEGAERLRGCLLYTSPSPRDRG